MWHILIHLLSRIRRLPNFDRKEMLRDLIVDKTHWKCVRHVVACLAAVVQALTGLKDRAPQEGFPEFSPRPVLFAFYFLNILQAHYLGVSLFSLDIC